MEILVTSFLVATGIFGLAAPFLPLWAMWRAALAAALCFAAMWLVNGPVHWTDQDFGYAMAIVVFWQFGVALGLALAVRLAVARYRGRLTAEALRGPGWVAVDAALMDLGGVVLGAVIVAQMGWALAGSGVGPGFDWAVGALALAAGVALTALAVYRRSLRPILAAATLGVVGALSLWGAGQSGRILAQAEARAGSAPWCLARDLAVGPLAGRSDLGFFGLHKARHTRHLELIIETDQGLERHHWSIRQQRFVASGLAVIATCHPSAAPADRFAAVHAVILGPRRLIIPESAAPQLSHNAYSDLSDGVLSVADPRGGAARVFMRLGPMPEPRPGDAPLDPLPDPATLDLAALRTGALQLSFGGAGPDGAARIDCLRGAYADEMCRVLAGRGGAVYTFNIPLSELRDWPAHLDLIASHFASFETRP